MPVEVRYRRLRSAPRRRGPSLAGMKRDYVLIHVVTQELMKDLIGPQVIDPMRWQATEPGVDAPLRVGVLFLEPARNAVQPRYRQRAQYLAARAAPAHVMLAPYVSRVGIGVNARAIALRVRAFAGSRAIVFHCRGEAAGEWALAIARHLEKRSIVTDVRGAWPEELLYAQAFDGPVGAPPALLRAYHLSLARLHTVLASSGSVVTVSRGMQEWLEGLGVDARRIVYVPCCVSDIYAHDAARAEMRRQLRLDDQLVFSYSGTVTRYQHLDDGVGAFFRAVQSIASDVHLLCTTNDPQSLEADLRKSGVDMQRASVRRLPQEHVAAHLVAADAGMILRAPSRMNHFSQPTKFAEYLASGVPVIASRGTGIIADLVEKEGAGIRITCFGLSPAELSAEATYVVRRLREEGAAMRLRAVALCEREFLWRTYVAPLRAAYRAAQESRLA